MTDSTTIEISLTQGYVAKVDQCDFDLLSMNWRVFHNGKTKYGLTSIGVNKKRRNKFLHRIILERILGRPLKREEWADHINRDGLDNRRSNLRLANRSQNSANSIRSARNTSGFKGASWSKSKNKWHSRIRVNTILIHLGYFDTPEQAHEAYKRAAIKYFGEFARFE